MVRRPGGLSLTTGPCAQCFWRASANTRCRTNGGDCLSTAAKIRIVSLALQDPVENTDLYHVRDGPQGPR